MHNLNFAFQRFPQRTKRFFKNTKVGNYRFCGETKLEILES